MKADTAYNLVQTAAPAVEPVTLQEAKHHLRIDFGDDDLLITGLIGTAREMAEKHTHRQLITATWSMRLPGFPCDGVILLPRPPLQAVSSITYLDAANVQRTLDASRYVVKNDRTGAEVHRAYGQEWPATWPHPEAVTVTYTAGYGAAGASVPASIRQAMLLLIGHLYENREATSEKAMATVPLAVEHLLDAYAVWR